MTRCGFLAAAILCMSAQAQAEGLGSLLGRPNDAVIDCLMRSGLMEDAGMFISDRAVTVVGPGGWQVTVTGATPAKARIDARDAAGRPKPALDKAFRAALDGCR
jgi:hypothetical protein